ncbi:MAG: NUDIX domain-containing protein [Patescibacteria group bacterium]
MQSQIDINKLTYRKGVIGIVIDGNNEFLITQLVDYSENEWRFAGGGVDEGETSEEALLRELKEEVGSTSFKILRKSKHQIKYDWPMSVIEARLIKKSVTYKGQVQDQFLVMFTGSRQEIVTKPDEIRKIKWVKYAELQNHFNFPNQWKDAEISLKELVPNLAD